MRRSLCNRFFLFLTAKRLSEFCCVQCRFLPLFVLFSLTTCFFASAQNRFVSESDSIGVQVFFRKGYSTLQPAFHQNGIRLDEFMRRVFEMQSDSAIRISAVDIVAFSSPDGSLKHNISLARKRADNIAAYLRDGMPYLSASLFNVQPKGIDWNGLIDMVSASDMKYRSEVLNILRNVPETTYRNGKLVDSRLKHLMDLRGGRPYWYMYDNLFPALRAAGAYVVCDFERIATIVDTDTVKSEDAVVPVHIEESDTVISEPIIVDETEVSVQAETSSIIEPQLSTFKDYDRWAIKSNALYLTAGITNFGAEYAFSHHWSVDFPLVYSPYTIDRAYRMRFLYIQPEARYWLDCPMRGHFFGVHLHAGVFNVSLDNNNRYQSEKGFHGGGISYGYSLPFAKRWSAEFTIGIGYAFTKYCTYYNVPNGIRYEKDIPYNYWGITKLGVNIVYRFGNKSDKRKELKP